MLVGCRGTRDSRFGGPVFRGGSFGPKFLLFRRQIGESLDFFQSFQTMNLCAPFQLVQRLHDYAPASPPSRLTVTLICAVTSRWSFTGTWNSPRLLSGSSRCILRRSTLKPFASSALAISAEVT